jgi:protoheme ferro-lyase
VLAQTPPEWRGPEVALVLAAHGTVLEPPRPIDTGLAATQALCDAIAARLAPHFGLAVNGWLNHTRGGRWTEPPIDEALQRVAASGCTRVVYYPYGFLADNAESELEGRVALAAQPRLASRHLPCLNGAPSLVAALARQIREAAGAPTAASGLAVAVG